MFTEDKKKLRQFHWHYYIYVGDKILFHILTSKTSKKQEFLENVIFLCLCVLIAKTDLRHKSLFYIFSTLK